MTLDPHINALFGPLEIGQLNIPNRLAMAPMTRVFSPGNAPDASVTSYYRKRAEGGTGLLITEGIGIDQAASIGEGSGAADRIPLLHGERAMAGWREVVSAVHGAGAAIFPQLWHQGAFRIDGTGPVPNADTLSPSGLWGPVDGYSTVAPEYKARVIEPRRPMTEEDIADCIAGFARSASNAKACGFDGIAIHGASGYLIDSFFWSETNRRSDRWGGDIAARTLFGAEVVRAIRHAIGPDMPILFRFAQWKQQDFNARIAQTPEELGAILQPLSDAGVDMFDAATIYYGTPAFEGSDLSLAGWAKRLTGKPAMAGGGVGLSEGLFSSFRTGGARMERNFVDAATRIESGEFDMIALGRALIADPAWPAKTARGEPTRDYSLDMLAHLD